MRYDLSDPLQAQQARTRLESLAARGSRVELTEKKVRSLPQNAYLHVCLAWFALQVGETLDVVKRRYYKEHCSPDIFVREKTDAVLHSTVRWLRSTASLTGEEMSLTIERFRNFASREAGIYIPEAGEHAFITRMEDEVERGKAWIY